MRSRMNWPPPIMMMVMMVGDVSNFSPVSCDYDDSIVL